MQSLEFGFPPAPAQTCRVVAGVGALTHLVEELAHRPHAALFLLTDSIVAGLHGESLARQLRTHGFDPTLIEIPAGESHKTRETKALIEDRLAQAGAGRDSLLLAVGGGVVGDLGGFVASTWNRGIPVIQVPTTLLSMVDASLGGKTGANLPAAKNAVGTFHQPLAIYADVRTLQTLPEPIYREGLAEVVKAAVVADREFFHWLEESVSALNARQLEVLERAVTSCMRIKGRIVTRDEREGGLRAVLNFGHTVAHAVEAVAGYRVSHGQAVAMGLVVEGRMAVRANGFPEDHWARMRRLLEAFRLPTEIPVELDRDKLVAACYRDKKVRERRLYYALPIRIGQMQPADRVTQSLPEADLRREIA